MLYHLMQASNGKDITLHVSANNPAMVRCVVFVLLFVHPVVLRRTCLLLFGVTPLPPHFSYKPVSLSHYKEQAD